NYFDGTFRSHWQTIANLQNENRNMYKGAYHFMSADPDPGAQAKNLLSTMGRLGAYDLPPTLDLEWDFQSTGGNAAYDANGNPIDRWASYSSDQIVGRVLTWLRAVQQATGRQPLIYTNYHWWQQRIGNRPELRGYKVWIADYASKS